MTDDQQQRAQGYNTAMIVVGYGGIFALLSYTHEKMTVPEKGLAAGCLLVSLSVFIAWVVSDMVLTTLGITPKASRWAYMTGWILALVGTLGGAGIAAVVMFRVYWRMLFMA